MWQTRDIILWSHDLGMTHIIVTETGADWRDFDDHSPQWKHAHSYLPVRARNGRFLYNIIAHPSSLLFLVLETLFRGTPLNTSQRPWMHTDIVRSCFFLPSLPHFSLSYPSLLSSLSIFNLPLPLPSLPHSSLPLSHATPLLTWFQCQILRSPRV